ncbi:MAG TPA: alpha/beta hydrolase [Candidatus Paceibacterota bacterium]
MKRAIIIHCWDGYPEYCWYPYAKKELEANGFQVEVPSFPETNAPKLDLWLPVLKEVVGTPDEDVYLIGHSVGCVTILRYLESLAPSQKIGGAILVAGFTDDLGFKELKNFFTTDIQLDEIKKRANHFVAIHSDDDPFVALKYGDIFKEKLGAEVIIKHNFKHFSGSRDKEDSCVTLPDVVESMLKISNKNNFGRKEK